MFAVFCTDLDPFWGPLWGSTTFWEYTAASVVVPCRVQIKDKALPDYIILIMSQTTADTPKGSNLMELMVKKKKRRRSGRSALSSVKKILTVRCTKTLKPKFSKNSKNDIFTELQISLIEGILIRNDD